MVSSPSSDVPAKGLTVEGAREQVAMLVSEERRVWESGLSWSIPVDGGSVVRACGGNGTGSLGALVGGDDADGLQMLPIPSLGSEPRELPTEHRECPTPSVAGFSPDPEKEDTSTISSLVKFTWQSPGLHEPNSVLETVSGPIYKGQVPCFWAPGGRVLEVIVLETISTTTRVYYQLIKAKGGNTVDACFVSCGIPSTKEDAEAALGEWTVNHPKCPPPTKGVKRLQGTVGFIIRRARQTKLDSTPVEISGVSQTVSAQQQAAIAGFFNGFRAFSESRLGKDLVQYNRTSMLCRSVLSEMMLQAWQWAADVGLWTKGKTNGTKVWRSGRPGGLMRSIRFQGTVPGVHAATLAQAMFRPEFKRSLMLGAMHSVSRIRVLETLGQFAKVLHVEETKGGVRRDYCVVSCLAALAHDTWIIAEWSMEHQMAPRIKNVERIHPRTAYLICVKNEEDTTLVVAREESLGPGQDMKDIEKQLEDLPFEFASGIGTLLQSNEGKELLGASLSGLRGRVMHGGGGGLLVPILTSVPCLIDCLDAITRPFAAVCCKMDLMRIKPAIREPC